MDPVLAIVRENEVVFAIWQDMTEPHGVGWQLIKGAVALRRAAEMKQSLPVRTSAIKCVNADQAEALFQAYGEKLDLH